jgi:leucyl aminopeptidase (aminopeptidase T)
MASMPGITEGALRRAIDIDYKRMKEDSMKLILMLSRASKARIRTIYGSELELGLRSRKAHGTSAGIYNKKGKWGNLPEGEAFIAPIEGTANGTFVVDGSISGFGKVSHPLVFFVEDGFAVKITDGKKPPKIGALLDKIGKNARNIAEFGIGLNRKAKITGEVLEDEKVYGTCHIALGNNLSFGGKVDVPLHLDCVMIKPDIYLDDELIMRKGKLVV